MIVHTTFTHNKITNLIELLQVFLRLCSVLLLVGFHDLDEFLEAGLVSGDVSVKTSCQSKCSFAGIVERRVVSDRLLHCFVFRLKVSVFVSKKVERNLQQGFSCPIF